MIIATEEQNAGKESRQCHVIRPPSTPCIVESRVGNYRDAHSLLQHMYQELIGHDIVIPMEMERNLQLLHSYVIVRMHIRRGQHLNAARLLIRVAESISKFPSRMFIYLFSPFFLLENFNCHRVTHFFFLPWSRRGSDIDFDGDRVRPCWIEECRLSIRGYVGQARVPRPTGCQV